MDLDRELSFPTCVLNKSIEQSFVLHSKPQNKESKCIVDWDLLNAKPPDVAENEIWLDITLSRPNSWCILPPRTSVKCHRFVCVKWLSKLDEKRNIVLQWIPAHCGIPGNEEADKLAKIGSETNDDKPSSLTYAEVKTILKTKWNNDWKKNHSDYTIEKMQMHSMEREQQKTIFRLRTGHGCLRAHLHKQDKTDKKQELLYDFFPAEGHQETFHSTLFLSNFHISWADVPAIPRWALTVLMTGSGKTFFPQSWTVSLHSDWQC